MKILILAGNCKFFNVFIGLPDTSILETSTEDLDTSQNDDLDVSQNEEPDEPPAKQAKLSEEKMDVSGINLWFNLTFYC